MPDPKFSIPEFLAQLSKCEEPHKLQPYQREILDKIAAGKYPRRFYLMKSRRLRRA